MHTRFNFCLCQYYFFLLHSLSRIRKKLKGPLGTVGKFQQLEINLKLNFLSSSLNYTWLYWFLYSLFVYCISITSCHVAFVFVYPICTIAVYCIMYLHFGAIVLIWPVYALLSFNIPILFLYLHEELTWGPPFLLLLTVTITAVLRLFPTSGALRRWFLFWFGKSFHRLPNGFK